MKTNVGGIDRTLRVLVGLTAIGAGIVTRNWWGALGLVPLGTAVIGWCPLYLPFGLSSCRAQRRR